LQPELCKSVHKCIFGEFLKFFPIYETIQVRCRSPLVGRVQPHVDRWNFFCSKNPVWYISEGI
jgi:hypothetical protein